jgi:type II secretory pathway component PulC
VIGVAVVGAVAGVGYWAELNQSPEPRAALEQPTPTQRAAVPPPPFFIKGTVLSPDSRLAHVAVLDDAQRERQVHQVREGETLEGYRLARIDNHRVYFERDGVVFLLPVGGSQPALETPVPADAQRLVPQKERTGEFVPPPANIEEIRRETDSFVEQLRQNPEFRKALEQKQRELQERQGASDRSP